MTSAIMNGVALLVMPLLLMGIIYRTKSLWSGRKGPPLLQPAYDVLRLFRKTSIYSATTTPIFRMAPWIYLITAIGAAVVTPLLGARSIVSFPFDFVWFAYAWALGRVGIMLAALDTGSSFEGMGGAREAAFSTLLEPVIFLVVGALCLSSGTHTLRDALVAHPLQPFLSARVGGATLVVWLCAVTTLFIVLQVETARMPIDDPTTHLELTMVHEVMVLDHSGPDLAVIQYGLAIKFYVCAALLATLFNPWGGRATLGSAAMNLALCVLIAIVIGTVESLIARLKLRAVPKYIAVALIAAIVALLATAWRTTGAA